MDQESIDRILDELFPNFEPLESQSAALLHLLKAKGLITDEELAPFLQQAANAASVRWLAVRVRVEALIANLLNPPEESSAAPIEESSQQAAESDQTEPEEKDSPESGFEQKDEIERESAARKAAAKQSERANDDLESAA
jgi:hypothetical protein